MENIKNMEKKAINEFDIIDIIQKNNTSVTENLDIVKSIGDDCAVISLGINKLVITTDMLFKSTHFPELLTPFQIGKRVVTANVSDIASMCAKPLGIVVSMGFDAETANKNYIDELSRGINSACCEYECPLLGGDTNKSKELVLSGTAFGITPNPVFRDFNLKNRLKTEVELETNEYESNIYITNDLGKVSCALMMYEKYLVDKKNGVPNDFNRGLKLINNYPEIFKKLSEPKARIFEGMVLNGHINTCCDISDGLGKDITYINNFELNSEDILNCASSETFEFCEELDIDDIGLLDLIFNSGEEFELLFSSFNSSQYLNNKLEKIESKNKNKSKVQRIGKTIENGQYIDGVAFDEFHEGVVKGYVHRWND
ncbi:thiamine-monophosphate kinase [Methanococcus voltae]|uniref:thiamine-phosphate kinase n=1 Tax=Methanococcus voltae TaxID=2188 RepID=UPI001FD9DD1A|nr:thiamine-phosphate kinase [Methanococcus voltae]MBP2143531.1 thiamine-monophosphate kinase [Methanococcus voltae]